MTPLAKRTLERAEAALSIHVHEVPAHSNRGPQVSLYLAFVGLGPGNPWCAAFACFEIWHAARDLGIRSEFPVTGSTSAIAHWARATGNLLAHPEPGCVGLLRGDAYGTGYVHTCLVEGVDGDHVLTIEGNDRDAVSRGRRPIAGSDFARIT